MRFTAAVAAVFFSFVGVTSGEDAVASVRKPTSIPAEGLGAALQTLARERGLQIVYVSDEVNALRTQGATGNLTGEEALRQLLAGTGMTYRSFGESAVSIVPLGSEGVAGPERPGSAPPAESPEPERTSTHEARKSFWDRFRLAQAAGTNGTTDAEERTAEGTTRLDEVIVTAQKREQRAFDVPISIVAMGADELQKRKVTGLDDLSLAVPGLFVFSSGSYQRQIMMRGISNMFGSKSALIGLYLDEASITATSFIQPDLRTYDLDRVEVLRGPQGTLYGEGSAGGTIRFITKNPVLDRSEMKADVAAMFTEDGAPGQRIEGVLNVPLIQGRAGLRIAGTFDHEGGWIDQPAANRNNYNEQNLVNVRIKGLWQPTAQLAVNAMAVIHRNDAPPNIGEDARGEFTQVFNLTTTPSTKDDYDLYNLTLTYDFSGFRLLSATSYIEQQKDNRDLGALTQFNSPPPPQENFYWQWPIDFKSVTEELRLTSTGSGRLQWTMGGVYRHARYHEFFSSLFSSTFSPGAPLPAPSSYDAVSLSDSWAAFGDASYQLTDRLTVGAGLRYYADDQEYTSGSVQSDRFDSLNPRLYGQYRFTDRVNAYASAAKGFRSGGFNRLNEPTYGPESVWTYELGTKMSLFEGRLSADTALFYSDYTDFQALGIPKVIGAGNITSNVGSARIEGIEWGVTWRPVDQWSLSFNGNRVRSRFYEIEATSSQHIVGDPLDQFPKYGYALSAQRDFRWNGKGGFARLDYEERGRAVYRFRSLGPWYYSQSDVINMLNLNVSMQWNDALSLGVFAQNLLNDRGFTDPFAIEGVAARSRPRTFGIQFGVSFE